MKIISASYRLGLNLPTPRTVGWGVLCLLLSVKLEAGEMEQDARQLPPENITYGKEGDNQAGTTVASAVIPDRLFPIHFTLNLGGDYNDNILIQPNKTYDYVFNIAPQATYKSGEDFKDDTQDANLINLDYTATIVKFLKTHEQNNSLNHNALAQYQHRFSRETLGLKLSYVNEQVANISAGTLLKDQVYDANIQSDYVYDERFSITSIGDTTYTHYDVGNALNTWDNYIDNYFLYDFNPETGRESQPTDSHLRIGIGPRIGYKIFEANEVGNEPYEQILTHELYNYSDKLSFDLSPGLEYREYEQDLPNERHFFPIADADVVFKPFPSTNIKLDGSRHLVSGVQLKDGPVVDNHFHNIVTLSVRQRFLHNYYFTISGSYVHDNYLAPVQSTYLDKLMDRVDDYVKLDTGITWEPNKYCHFGVNYEFAKDNSTLPDYTYDNNIYSVNAGFNY